ncbi:hypothetical protein LX32DRAFT_595318 [Colletotrichum zoysiae]|uniref:Uncharacterized protein n=1 Tax=Colletotrichum zoysiae TaxID=1216348 RepID=A0AAD9LYZ3_9PEZI|nr:hypothetical protein LX32DRAFT_595318 [Colletotrichum zoysiae]
MCWTKQTIYKGCRHGCVEETICDDEKQRRRERERRSSWLVLLCPCFFLAPAAPGGEERCRLKPILEPLNGKCPRCLEEEANAAVCSGPGFVDDDDDDDDNPPRRPEAAVADASRRYGFIGDKHLHAAGRPASAGPRRDTRRGRSGPSSRSRREGTDPVEARRARQPLYTNVRYEKAVRRERLRREQRNPEAHEHYSQHAQRTPGYRSGNQDQDQDQGQGPSGPTAGPGGHADSQPFQPLASTAHLAPRPLQRSLARADRDVARGAGANGRSTARARRSAPLSDLLEDGSGWGAQDDTAAGPPESTPGLSLDELIEEVEELWRTAPNQRR